MGFCGTHWSATRKEMISFSFHVEISAGLGQRTDSQGAHECKRPRWDLESTKSQREVDASCSGDPGLRSTQSRNEHYMISTSPMLSTWSWERTLYLETSSLTSHPKMRASQSSCAEEIFYMEDHDSWRLSHLFECTSYVPSFKRPHISVSHYAFHKLTPFTDLRERMLPVCQLPDLIVSECNSERRHQG